MRLDNVLPPLESENVEEVIVALSPTVEGETTGSYLASLLHERAAKAKVAQLARGLPFGGDLDYSDQETIAGALRGRREL